MSQDLLQQQLIAGVTARFSSLLEKSVTARSPISLLQISGQSV